MLEIFCAERYDVCCWQQHIYSLVMGERSPQQGREKTAHNSNNLILYETMSVTSRAYRLVM